MKKGIIANGKDKIGISMRKQKWVPGARPAPPTKPRDRKAGNKYTVKYTKNAKA